MHLLYILSTFLPSVAKAALVSYNWDISWLQANPDGRQARPVIGINGQWPGPTIRASVGDTVSVTVNNRLDNETTSIHYHGIKQRSTNQMDGPPSVVACPIPPGEQFTYEFHIEDPGTYWWHAHSDGQYVDGLRGPMIINDPKSPYANQYDEELVMSLTDWYHDKQSTLRECYLSPSCNPSGAEPVPFSALMNEGVMPRYNIVPGRTYFIRIINMAAFAQVYLNFDQHDVEIVEVDGVYTQKQKTQSLYIATGQRYAVLLRTKASSSQNYAITASMDVNAFDNVPGYLSQNATGYLVYDASKPLPPPPSIPMFQITDDIDLTPHDKQPALRNPTMQISLDLDFFPDSDQNRAGFNEISYRQPKVPTLYSVLSAPSNLVNNPQIYGNGTHAIVLQAQDIVEITINNGDDGQHPLHIHGHQVQIISRVPGQPRKKKQKFRASNAISSMPGAPPSRAAIPFPIRRDTFTLAGSGKTVIRFVADNPGVWHFHCHMEWHLSAGLGLVLIEAPEKLRATQAQLSPSMQRICKGQGIPTSGNAMGNQVDWFDVSGNP